MMELLRHYFGYIGTPGSIQQQEKIDLNAHHSHLILADEVV